MWTCATHRNAACITGKYALVYMTDILTKIAETKRQTVESLKRTKPLEGFIDKLSTMPSPGFKEALSRQDGPNIIAEIKKASPSKGVLLADFDPVVLAEKYRDGGACALSVLTEEKHFQGRAEYMKLAKEHSGLPVLCKDFIIDKYQLYYAKLMAADAVLLIAGLHSVESLSRFISVAREIGLDTLVEAHNEEELETALSAGADIVGVNNRNLTDFSVSLETSERLAARIPDGVIKVAESGIFSAGDIARLRKSGYNCFLIGEALVTADNPTELLKSLRRG